MTSKNRPIDNESLEKISGGVSMRKPRDFYRDQAMEEIEQRIKAGEKVSPEEMRRAKQPRGGRMY